MAVKRGYTPLWIRLWHWAVAALFVSLVFTGVVLTFSGSRLAMMDYDLATTLHDVTGISLAVLYVLFLVAATATGYWRRYANRWQGLLKRIGRQGLRVLGWSPAATSSQTQIGQGRIDIIQPLLLLVQQLLCLISIAVVLPTLIVTGLFYLYPETAPSEVLGLAGLWPMAVAHYIAGLFGAIFLLLHIYIATMAGLRRMIWGR